MTRSAESRCVGDDRGHNDIIPIREGKVRPDVGVLEVSAVIVTYIAHIDCTAPETVVWG